MQSDSQPASVRPVVAHKLVSHPEWSDRPLKTDTVEQRAGYECLFYFEDVYEGKVCDVCGSEKWANSPFCRSCSITLQHSNMMARFAGMIQFYGTTKTPADPKNWQNWPSELLLKYFTYWDLCRDYLFQKRAGRQFESEECEPGMERCA